MGLKFWRSATAILITFVCLCGTAFSPGRAEAVSPVPSEIMREAEKKPSAENGIVCIIRISHGPDKSLVEEHEITMKRDEASSVKDAVEKCITSIENKLREEGVSNVSLDCSFSGASHKE